MGFSPLKIVKNNTNYQTMPNSRKKVIDIFIELLSSKGTLIIHDTNRNDEMYAYESIRRKFLSSVRFETKKGISILCQSFLFLSKICFA